MNFIKISLFLALPFCFCGGLQAQNTTTKKKVDCPPSSSENIMRLKALYLFNFYNSINSDQADKEEDFQIAFMEGDSVKSYFDKMIRPDKADRLRTVSINKIEQAVKYKMAYLPTQNPDEVKKLNQLIEKSKSLIITEEYEFPNYTINLIVQNCKLEYMLNAERLRALGFQPGEELTKRAYK